MKQTRSTRVRPWRSDDPPCSDGLANFCAARLVSFLGAGLLAACASQPAVVPPVTTPAPSTPAVVAPPAPEPAPAVAEVPAPSPAPGPSPVSPQDAPKVIASAIEFLQAGQEEQAENELRRVLLVDANNRQAQSLLKQMKDDPMATLGRESFPYRVQPGESLSRIAQRFLGDVQQFYILARYNNLKVPRTLAEGQTIRIPGKAPAVATAPAASPTALPATPTGPASGEPAADAAATRAEAIARHTREARGAFAKQDLDAAIRSWEAVLKLDPDNRTAFLEREKILGLKEKLGKLK